jgi:glycosyltransferase involved in cell wall biosynthesis
MSLLRVLHVTPYYDHAWAYGGIPRVATTLTQALARNGHLISVYTTDACDEHSRADRQEVPADLRGRLEVQVFRNVSNRLAYHWQFFTPVGFRGRVRASAARFDIAHLHACHNLPVAVGARALSRVGVPYVVSPHGTAPFIERRVLAKRLFAATIGNQILTRAARVLAVSEAERHQLLALGVAQNRIAVVGNPLDDREFDPRPNGAAFRHAHGLSTAAVVMLLGKLTPRKGADVLLRAFEGVQTPNAHLVIAGSDMRSGAERNAESGSRVRSVGVLRGRERLEALAAADVLVYPSRDEVFGLVPIEALLCGTPVIVCDDSGCGEIIGAIGGGHVVPYGDAPTLAAAIDAVLSAPAIWRSRAAAAADRARRRFGATIVSEHVQRLYADVIRERSASRNASDVRRSA